jgi:hypothetical protein
MITGWTSYPDQIAARRAIEALRNAGVPDSTLRLLSGGALREPKRSAGSADRSARTLGSEPSQTVSCSAAGPPPRATAPLPGDRAGRRGGWPRRRRPARRARHGARRGHSDPPRPDPGECRADATRRVSRAIYIHANWPSASAQADALPAGTCLRLALPGSPLTAFLGRSQQAVMLVGPHVDHDQITSCATPPRTGERQSPSAVAAQEAQPRPVRR